MIQGFLLGTLFISIGIAIHGIVVTPQRHRHFQRLLYDWLLWIAGLFIALANHYADHLSIDTQQIQYTQAQKSVPIRQEPENARKSNEKTKHKSEFLQQ